MRHHESGPVREIGIKAWLIEIAGVPFFQRSCLNCDLFCHAAIETCDPQRAQKIESGRPRQQHL